MKAAHKETEGSPNCCLGTPSVTEQGSGVEQGKEAAAATRSWEQKLKAPL